MKRLILGLSAVALLLAQAPFPNTGSGGGGGGGGAGTIAFQSNGTPLGTSGTLNTVPGTGVTCVPSITAGTASIQCSVDSAVVPLKTNLQSATNPQICTSASGSGTTYTAACATTLGAYATKQTLFWYSDVTNTITTPTLNIDTLGAKTLVRNDGTALAGNDIKATILYRVWYDGTNIRVVEAGIAGSAAVRQWSCTIITGDPGAASAVLANDNDSPASCSNNLGSDVTITTVAAWADAGSPTVTPILTGGSGTSILTGALTAGTASWAAGAVNGTVTLHSFSGTGATCSSTPCTLDSNITVAGGTAKYLVVKFVGTY